MPEGKPETSKECFRSLDHPTVQFGLDGKIVYHTEDGTNLYTLDRTSGIQSRVLHVVAKAYKHVAGCKHVANQCGFRITGRVENLAMLRDERYQCTVNIEMIESLFKCVAIRYGNHGDEVVAMVSRRGTAMQQSTAFSIVVGYCPRRSQTEDMSVS